MAERVGFDHVLLTVGESLKAVGILLVFNTSSDLTEMPLWQRVPEGSK
jgi:hypothetical protein